MVAQPVNTAAQMSHIITDPCQDLAKLVLTVAKVRLRPVAQPVLTHCIRPLVFLSARPFPLAMVSFMLTILQCSAPVVITKTNMVAA